MNMVQSLVALILKHVPGAEAEDCGTCWLIDWYSSDVQRSDEEVWHGISVLVSKGKTGFDKRGIAVQVESWIYGRRWETTEDQVFFRAGVRKNAVLQLKRDLVPVLNRVYLEHALA